MATHYSHYKLISAAVFDAASALLRTGVIKQLTIMKSLTEQTVPVTVIEYFVAQTIDRV